MPRSRPMKNNFFCFVSTDSAPVSERPGTDIFIFLRDINRAVLAKILSLSGKFTVKLSLKIPSHVKRVATLPFEIKLLRKLAT